MSLDHNILIMMAADETEFHRAKTFDQRVYFKYTVDPPESATESDGTS